MKMEMEGREPLIVLFGVPTLTTAIVLVSMYLGPWHAGDYSNPPTINLQPTISVTPKVTAELPNGSIRNNIEVPPAQIHEMIREVVKVPDVNVYNKMDPALPPTIQVNVPRQEAPPAQTKVVMVPTPVPMPVATPVAVEPPVESAEGKLLPPPKGVGGVLPPR